MLEVLEPAVNPPAPLQSLIQHRITCTTRQACLFLSESGEVAFLLSQPYLPPQRLASIAVGPELC